MLIGLDFDNTIVCYDQLFHRLAVERGLVSPQVATVKQAVRDALWATGQADEWTELQGIAYGPRIVDAEPFPGVLAFLRRSREAGVQVAIVSHKSRHPFRGEPHDLHAAAHAFLELHGFYEARDTGLSPDRVFLELTLPEKLTRVGSLGCTAFVDDLPELLAEPAFPLGVRKVLFDTANAHPISPPCDRVTSWKQCADLLLSGREACV
jgi:FMN phosphatase YigB (HAD superfamily)